MEKVVRKKQRSFSTKLKIPPKIAPHHFGHFLPAGRSKSGEIQRNLPAPTRILAAPSKSSKVTQNAPKSAKIQQLRPKLAKFFAEHISPSVKERKQEKGLIITTRRRPGLIKYFPDRLVLTEISLRANKLFRRGTQQQKEMQNFGKTRRSQRQKKERKRRPVHWRLLEKWDPRNERKTRAR